MGDSSGWRRRTPVEAAAADTAAPEVASAGRQGEVVGRRRMEDIAQMGPMLVLAGLTVGWVVETVRRAGGPGFLGDLIVGLARSGIWVQAGLCTVAGRTASRFHKLPRIVSFEMSGRASPPVAGGQARGRLRRRPGPAHVPVQHIIEGGKDGPLSCGHSPIEII